MVNKREGSKTNKTTNLLIWQFEGHMKNHFYEWITLLNHLKMLKSVSLSSTTNIYRLDCYFCNLKSDSIKCHPFPPFNECPSGKQKFRFLANFKDNNNKDYARWFAKSSSWQVFFEIEAWPSFLDICQSVKGLIHLFSWTQTNGLSLWYKFYLNKAFAR